ncbi:MAG: DinB family protein [Gemmatimonadetes bacterium]|nr:DinB family protein [Gemmatimonadota bacterium]
MQTIFDPANERATLARLERLTPDAPARFGKFNAHRMMCHLIDASLIALGDKPVRAGTGPLTFPPLRYAMLFLLPWPKGKVKTHKEFLETKPAEFEADRARLRALLAQVAQRGRDGGPFQPHPAFGRLSVEHWGGLVLRHVDHHFAQFGV